MTEDPNGEADRIRQTIRECYERCTVAYDIIATIRVQKKMVVGLAAGSWPSPFEMAGAVMTRTSRALGRCNRGARCHAADVVRPIENEDEALPGRPRLRACPRGKTLGTASTYWNTFFKWFARRRSVGSWILDHYAVAQFFRVGSRARR